MTPGLLETYYFLGWQEGRRLGYILCCGLGYDCGGGQTAAEVEGWGLVVHHQTNQHGYKVLIKED